MSLDISLTDKMVTRISEVPVPDVDQVSLKQLRDAVAGRSTVLSRTQAMTLLLDSDFPNKHRDFEAVLENESEPAEIRYLAAIYLGRTQARTASSILIRNTQTRDERVLAGVVKALGIIGDEMALKAVLEVGECANRATTSQVRFAAALISHRLGLRGNDIPIPQVQDYLEISASDARPLQIVPAGEKEAEFCLRSLGDQPLGIEFSEHPMYQFRCGRNSWMLLFNRDYVGNHIAKKWMQQKAIFGALALRNQATKLYSIGFVLLTSPNPQGQDVDILVCRSNGVIAFGGSARVDADHAEFSIQAVTRPGAFAIHVRGEVSDGKVAFWEATVCPFSRIPKHIAIEE